MSEPATIDFEPEVDFEPDPSGSSLDFEPEDQQYRLPEGGINLFGGTSPLVTRDESGQLQAFGGPNELERVRAEQQRGAEDLKQFNLREHSEFWRSIAAQIASSGLNTAAAFSGGPGRAAKPEDQGEYERIQDAIEGLTSAVSTGIISDDEFTGRNAALRYRLKQLEGEEGKLPDQLRGAAQHAWEFYNASPEAKNPAAQLARAGGQFFTMLPTMIGTGPLGLPLAGAQAGGQAYSEAYSAVEKGLRAQGITDEAQIAAESEKAATGAAVKTAPALLLYMAGGKIFSKLAAKGAGVGASPLKSALFGVAGAEVSNIGAGTVLRAVESGEWKPTIETLTLDTLFALYHGVGEYSRASGEAKRRALEEIISRGVDPGEIPKTEPQPGQTPAQQVVPKTETQPKEAQTPKPVTPDVTTVTPEITEPPLSPRVAASITSLPEALFDRGFPEYEAWKAARTQVGFEDVSPETHAAEKAEYEGAAKALQEADLRSRVAPQTVTEPAVSVGGSAEPVAETPAPAAPEAKPETKRKRSGPPDGGFADDPLIQFIEGAGGIWSKTTGKKKWSAEKYEENKSLWEDAPKFANPRHNRIYKEGGIPPDQMAAELVNHGLLPEGATERDLWEALGKASQSYERTRLEQAGQKRGAAAAEETQRTFERAASTQEPGDKPVNVSDLAIGDEVTIGGEKFIVKEIDPDTYDVTMQDGPKFGVQTIEGDKVIYAENVHQIEQGVEFIGETEQEPPPAKTEPPKLREKETGTGELFQGKDQPFNLAGEEGVDWQKRQQEQDAAEKARQEAAALQEKQQQQLFGSPKRPEAPPEERPPTRGDAIQGAPPAGTAARPRLAPVPPADWDGKRVNAPNVIDALANAMEAFGSTAPLRQGRTTTRGEGEFDPRQVIARIRTANDIPVAAHEVAHGIEEGVFGYDRKVNPWTSPRIGPAVQRELVALGRALYPGKIPPAGGWRREGFAEFVRLWVTEPAKATAAAPQFHRWFTDVFLKDNPKGANALQFARTLAARWDKQGAMNRGEQSIADASSAGSRFKKTAGKAADLASITNWVEALQPLKELKSRIEEELGRQLGKDEDFVFTADALRRTHDGVVAGMVSHGMRDLSGKITGPALNDVVRLAGKGGKNRRAFMLYLWARRALALWNDPRGPRDPGLSRQDASFIANKLHTPERALAAQKVYDWNDGVLNYVAESSPAYAKLVKAIRDRDPGNYIPLQREFEKASTAWNKATGTRDARLAQLGRRLRGSGRRIKDPFEQMVSQAVKFVESAHQRMIFDQLIKFRDTVPGLGDVFAEVPVEQVKLGGDSVEGMLKKIESELRKVGGNMLVDDNGADLSQIMINLFGPKATPSRGETQVVPIIDTKRDPTTGKLEDKMRWFEVPDNIHDALMATDVKKLHWALDLVGGMPARLKRTFTTALRASFALVTNPARDLNTWINQTRSGANPAALTLEYLKQLALNGLHAVTGGKISSEGRRFIERMGGQMATPLGQDMSTTRRVTRQMFQGRVMKTFDPRNIYDFIRDLFQFPELSARAGEVEMIAKKRGWDLSNLTAAQARELLLAAKRATVDFAAAGKLAGIYNQVVPFFNAGIQGPRSYLRNWKENPKQAAIGHVAMAAFAAWAWWKNKDKKWWKEMGRDEKYRYTYVDTGDELIRIPREQQYGGIPMGLTEAALDAWYDDRPQEVLEWGKSFLKHNTPDAIPVLPGEILDQARNFDHFYERKIVPESMERLSERRQYDEYTSRLAVKIGELFGESPKRIEHAISGIGGPGLDDYIKQIGGTVGGSKEGMKEPADFPVIGTGFQRGGPSARKPQSIEKFYEILDKAQRAQADLKADGKEESPDQKSRRLMLDSANDALKAARLLARDAKNPQTRREAQEAQTDIARAAVRAYGEKWLVTVPPTLWDDVSFVIGKIREESENSRRGGKAPNALRKQIESIFAIQDPRERQKALETLAGEIKEMRADLEKGR